LLQTALADLCGTLAVHERPFSEDLLSNDQDLIKRFSNLLLEALASRLPAEQAKDPERSTTPSSDRKVKHHVRLLSRPDIPRPVSRTFDALSRPFRRDRSFIALDEEQAPPTTTGTPSPPADQSTTKAIKEIKEDMMRRLSSTTQDTMNEKHDPKLQARAGLSLATYGNSIAALMALNHIVALRSLDENTASPVSNVRL